MTRTRAWWPIAIYPCAFPLAMVILIWGQAEISVLELIRPAVVAVGASLLVTLACSLLAGDRRYGGIAATAITVALVVQRPEAIVLLLVVAVGVLVIARLPGARDVRRLPLVDASPRGRRGDRRGRRRHRHGPGTRVRP